MMNSKHNKKRISVKKLKPCVHKYLSIHPDLKSDADISSSKIDNIIKKNYGNKIEQKVVRNCISTIGEKYLDEISKE